MSQHHIQQPIRMIDIYVDADSDMITSVVGRDGVTRIEACTKSGLHADIPYVRVWKGEVCEAEFCQHNIVGVYFAEPEAPSSEHFHDHAACPGCDECLPF